MRNAINTLTNQAAVILTGAVVTVRDAVRALSPAPVYLKRDARSMAMRQAAQKPRGGESAVAGALRCLGFITPTPAVCLAWHTESRALAHPSA